MIFLYHVPIMADECIEGLNIKQDGIYADVTMGGGGHSKRILERIPLGRLYSLDRDEQAVRECSKLMTQYKNFQIIHANFALLQEKLEQLGVYKLDGILADLGVSSHQIDEGERGFSYMRDGQLDMRMDRTQGIDAKQVVNNFREEELTRIFFDYGEERHAKKIARSICRERPFNTTLELSECIKNVLPYEKGGHPAKRVFQALRIFVNDEMAELEKLLAVGGNMLKSGGRMAIITFHSLEDRIVKNHFRRMCTACICPPNFPKCVCGMVQRARLITRKPLTPSSNEMSENPRAQSAKLRIIEVI